MTVCDIDYLGLILFIDIDNNYYLFNIFELSIGTRLYNVFFYGADAIANNLNGKEDSV